MYLGKKLVWLNKRTIKMNKKTYKKSTANDLKNQLKNTVAALEKVQKK